MQNWFAICILKMDLRANLKNYLDNAFNGEPVIVSCLNAGKGIKYEIIEDID